MESGGQPGNQNARKGREWRNAINRALEKRGNGNRTKALDELAEKFLDAVEAMSHGTEKSLPSINGFAELADRLDGKAKQQTEITGDAESPLVTKMQVEFVRKAEDAQGADTGSV